MDIYSKLIATMKVLLVLLACVVMTSVVFLSSETTLEAIDKKGNETPGVSKLSGSMSGTLSRGTSGRGELFHFKTERTVFGSGEEASTANNPSGHIELENGTEIGFSADTGTFQPSSNRFNLMGNVQLRTSDGTSLDTPHLQIFLDQYVGLAPSSVRVQDALGSISSNELEFSWEASNLIFQFRGDVRLMYIPRERASEQDD